MELRIEKLSKTYGGGRRALERCVADHPARACLASSARTAPASRR